MAAELADRPVGGRKLEILSQRLEFVPDESTGMLPTMMRVTSTDKEESMLSTPLHAVPRSGHSALRRLWVVLLLGACGYPMEPTGGIVVYVDDNFRGDSKTFSEDVQDLEREMGGCGGSSYPNYESPDWGDCISSVRVLPGWQVTVYEDDRYRGQSVTFTADVANLEQVVGPNEGHFGDCISSLRISRTN